MSIIDSDDPSRMAVFPRGETVNGSQPESPLWGKGRDETGVEVEVRNISFSVSHTHTNTHTPILNSFTM